jgi:DNA polymerase III subunit epsilon
VVESRMAESTRRPPAARRGPREGLRGRPARGSARPRPCPCYLRKVSYDPDLEALVERLEASGDYRVLRRLRHAPRVDPAGLPAGAREALALDLETTGLDPDVDAPIEIGLVRFAYDDAGRILGVTGELGAFEDPGRPLTAEVTRLTGIRDEDVAGQRFPAAEVQALLDGVGLVVAHNAGFDRPFAERRFPAFERLAWGCSLRDIDWRGADGYEGASLGALLAAHGRFFGAHRAVEDGYAVIELLRQTLPASGELAFNLLRATARLATVRLWAVGSPFEAKDALKARGYRWTAECRAWRNDLAESDVDDEIAWLRSEAYGGRRMPADLPRFRIDARSRWSRRVPESPPG